MNTIWIVVLLSSIVCLFLTDPANVLISMIAGAEKGLSLSFELLAIYAVWLGILGIVSETKLSKYISRALSPFIDWLWGKNSMSREAKDALSLSLSTQLLGIGGASVPLGIKAIEKMDNKSGTITKPMIMTIVFACSGVQLIPTTVMGMMTAAGSTNPAYIIIPTILGGLFTTFVGVVGVKICGRIHDAITAKKQKNTPIPIEKPQISAKNVQKVVQK